MIRAFLLGQPVSSSFTFYLSNEVRADWKPVGSGGGK